jgi:DNA-directed RNA polymerase-3 subunit RPC5
MTYLDVISKRAAQRNRRRDSDSESDGPPPDPDEPPRPPSPKKEKKSAAGEAKEVQVRARQTEEKGLLGGLSTVRREMLMQMREEAEEKWESLDWHDGDVSLFNLAIPDHNLTRSLKVRRSIDHS